MPEPITLTVVGTIALTEGIKFLYSQAGEVLKCWRERRDAAPATAQAEGTSPVDVKLPDVFDGQLVDPKIHFDAVAQVEPQLRQARSDVADYAQYIEPVDPRNEAVLAQVDALRRLLEAVYQQRITFKGEHRPSSGPDVTGRIDAKQVAGYAAAVRADIIAGGTVTAEAKVDRVEQGGQLIGVDVKRIG